MEKKLYEALLYLNNQVGAYLRGDRSAERITKLHEYHGRAEEIILEYETQHPMTK